jgi:integrase
MARRPYGSGSVHRVNDPRRRNKPWRAKVHVGGGRYRIRWAATRREAERLVHELLAERARGVLPPPGRLTVRQFLEEWLAGVTHRLKPQSVQIYRIRLEQNILPLLGDRRLAALQPLELERLYRRLLEEGLGPATVRNVHSIVHKALADAVRRGYLSTNPADRVDPPRAAHPAAGAALTAEEARQLLAAARGDRLEALAVLALTTGMRKGELLALRWRDVDLEARVVRVTGTLVYLGGEYRIQEPKTASSRRAVALAELACSALRAHRQRQLEERLRAGPAWHDLDLVFCREDGYYLNPKAPLEWFHRVLERAGLRKVRLHDLRHTAATLAIASGVDVRTTGALLGHASAKMTLDTYGHALPRAAEAAARAIDAALRG